MLFLNVHSLSNGKHNVEIEGKAEGEFDTEKLNSLITVKGTLLVHNDKFMFTGTATTKANLTCDLSMEQYEELLETNLEITVLKGVKEEYQTEEDENTIYIGEEEKKANITDIVVQELLVKIPMKKVAPKYRGKELDEIYPSLKHKNEEKGNSPFDVLKDLKSNKN